MASNNDDKLICGRTARKNLNCSKAEFENLVNQGIIQAYRDEYMRWKVSKESVLNYAKQSQVSNVTRFICTSRLSIPDAICQLPRRLHTKGCCAGTVAHRKFVTKNVPPVPPLLVFPLYMGNCGGHILPKNAPPTCPLHAPQ